MPTDCFSTYMSPLGQITMASDGQSLTGLWFDGQKHFGSTLTPQSVLVADLPLFADVRRWLDLYFSGRDPGFMPPVRFRSSDFRMLVWRLLLTIPYAATTTYGALARTVAREMGVERMSAQAVAGAVARNPISLIVPCHRVIASDGSLAGYAGGLQRKEQLLALEQTFGDAQSACEN
ncbi:MAG: methylated-DNA--[Bacteroidaceae bacterium]|nr:methylated-DNA--[protein]-cysteine S-methyltransferase [Bacteroidaceae bacterium]